MSRQLLLTILSVSLIWSCSKEAGGTGAATDADREAINKAREAFMENYSAGDLRRCTDIYTEDAVLMPSNQSAVVGKEAIGEYLKTLFAQYYIKITLMSKELSFVNADWAYDWGTYALKLKSAEGRTSSDSGKYLVIWNKQKDGTWKIVRDIDNTSNAAPSIPERPTPSDEEPESDASSKERPAGTLKGANQQDGAKGLAPTDTSKPVPTRRPIDTSSSN